MTKAFSPILCKSDPVAGNANGIHVRVLEDRRVRLSRVHSDRCDLERLRPADAGDQDESACARHCCLSWSYWFLASEVVASIPPSPIVSTADDGTITIAPFSLMASYSMFIARRCSATGLSR